MAVALCQATFRPVAGLVTRRLAGTPLRWRLMLGWHPDSAGGRASPSWCWTTAVAAYTDSLAAHPDYLSWLLRHPEFGVRRPTPAEPLPGGAGSGVRTA